MLEEVIMRGWVNFIARTTGPMHLRFILQPAVAAFIAIRAGLRDARLHQPPFLWSLLTKRTLRPVHIHAALKDAGKVFLVAVLLDAIYQLRVQKGIYTLELVFTSATLAFVPYLLLRGPVNRLATWIQAKRPRSA